MLKMEHFTTTVRIDDSEKLEDGILIAKTAGSLAVRMPDAADSIMEQYAVGVDLYTADDRRLPLGEFTVSAVRIASSTRVASLYGQLFLSDHPDEDGVFERLAGLEDDFHIGTYLSAVIIKKAGSLYTAEFNLNPSSPVLLGVPPEFADLELSQV